jgi:hypothetical protein
MSNDNVDFIAESALSDIGLYNETCDLFVDYLAEALQNNDPECKDKTVEEVKSEITKLLPANKAEWGELPLAFSSAAVEAAAKYSDSAADIAKALC